MKIKIRALSINKAFCGRRFKTKDCIAYEKEVLYLLPKKIIIPKDKIELKIEVGMSSLLADLDNSAKLFIDLLSKKYNFNDRLIYRLIMEKIKVKKGEEYINFEIKNYENI